MDDNKTYQELQAENRILLKENKNMRRGVTIVYRWLRKDYPFSDLSQSEIESMLEKVSDMPHQQRV